MKPDLKLPSNKKFGFFFTLLFAGCALYFLYIEKNYLSYFFLILSMFFFLVTIIKAHLLLPLNKTWMQIGNLLGLFISPIILGVIYYFIFFPVGLFFRMIGRDELSLNDKKKESYWKKSTKTYLANDFFKKQF